MKMKWIYIAAFFVLVVVQLFIPSRMIYQREIILKKGEPFKFEIEPVDPSDPFRGEYIQLSFKQNDFKIKGHSWRKGNKVYVFLEKDKEGFASVTELSKTPPTDNTPHVTCSIQKVRLVNRRVIINYPFDTYYMSEFKASKAEKEFRETIAEEKIAYAIVYIRGGEAVLKDVIINNKSLNSYQKK